MRSVPRPVVVDLSDEARSAADGTVSEDFLRLINAVGGIVKGDNTTTTATATTATANTSIGANKLQKLRADFLGSMHCRLILLPSGRGLRGTLHEPPGSLTSGRLLYGGVTRYRVRPSSRGGNGGSANDDGNGKGRDAPAAPLRRAGERTERKSSGKEHVPSWAQYGRAKRGYDAVDMGPAMVLEWTLLPKIRDGSVGEEAKAVLALAAKRRTTASTDMNATSSRSHSVIGLPVLKGEADSCSCLVGPVVDR